MKRKIMLAVTASVVALLPVMAQAANKLIVKGTDGTTDKMVVTDGGYVGIGTNAPSTGIFVKGNSADNTNILSQFVGTTSWGGGNVNLMHNNNPTTNNGLPQANDRLGSMLFGSYITSTNRVAGGGVSGYADGNWTSTSAPTYFSFQTAPAGATSRIERMRVTSGGNIGIGTTTPAQKLDVNGGIRINTTAAKPTCSASIRGTIWFANSDTGVADKLEVCAKQSNDTYSWIQLL